MRERGRVVRCGRVAFKSNGAFLQLKLPSGRKISYPQPRIIGDEREQRVVFSDNADGQFRIAGTARAPMAALWTENVVSGIARDLLAEAMLRIEAAGYPIVLHVTTKSSPRCRTARQPRRIRPSHDTQASLGAGSADRSRSLERTPLLQIGGCTVPTG